MIVYLRRILQGQTFSNLAFFNRIVDMWKVLPQEWIKGTEKAFPIHTLFHR